MFHHLQVRRSPRKPRCSYLRNAVHYLIRTAGLSAYIDIADSNSYIVGMAIFGFLLGVIIVLIAVYFTVAIHRKFTKEIRKARQWLSENSRLLNTSLGPIEYSSAGRGDPVIVLHGAGGGYDQGLLISAALVGDDFWRIAVSRFGYLRSPMPVEPSYTLQADIIVELMDKLGIEKAFIIGVSAGGPSTIQFALRHSERCRGVILVSAVSHERPSLRWYQNFTFDLIFSSDFLYWCLVSWFPSSFYTAFGVPHEVQTTLTRDQRDSICNFLHSILPVSQRKSGTAHDRIFRDLDFPLEKIRLPVLVIHAMDDNIVPCANAEYAISRFPRVQSLILKTGGHLLIGQYHPVKQAVTAFLIQHSATGDK